MLITIGQRERNIRYDMSLHALWWAVGKGLEGGGGGGGGRRGRGGEAGGGGDANSSKDAIY